MIGQRKCQGFIGFHNFSGADLGGKFVGISKKTWVAAYMELDEDDPVYTVSGILVQVLFLLS